MDKIIQFLLKIYASFIKKDDKYIIFESAREFFDNPYALYLYIKEHYPQYKLKYVVTTKEMKKSASIRGINKKELLNVNNKLALYRYSLKAKLIVFSYTNYWNKLKLSPKNTIVYAAHSEFPVKYCGEFYDFILKDSVNKVDVSFRTKHTKEVMHKIYPVFDKHNSVILGMPRNDIMFHSKINKAEFLKWLGYEENKTIILSMTTFRHAHEKIPNYFEQEFPICLNEQEVEELDKKLGENNEIFIIKLHHSQDGVIISNKYKNIKFLTNQDLALLDYSSHDLYSISDSLISDYSTSYLGYLVLDRKVGFILTDKAQYTKERGYTLENWEDMLPGDKMYSKEDFYKFLKDVKSPDDKYKEARKKVMLDYVGDYKDQNCKSYTDHYLKNKKGQN